MRKTIIALPALVLTLVLALGVHAQMKTAMDLKPTDDVYACKCSEKCPCDTLSDNKGKCSCGVEMAKGKVLKAEEGKATVAVDGKEKEFDTRGKYACACGPGCSCNTISQNPGKCACGVRMKPVQSE